MLQENGDFEPLGKHWTANFIKRNKALTIGKSNHLDIKRHRALDNKLLQAFYDQWVDLRERYKIDLDDCYNMDKTGFQMGQTRSEVVIYTKSRGPLSIAMPGNTNWTSIIECISAIGRVIDPILIFVGKQVRSGWFPQEDIMGSIPGWEYTFSQKGWTDNSLGLAWLKRIFLL